MANFSNPFSGNVPDRKMTLEELVRAMRLNVAAEEDATTLYMAHAEATDHPLAKKVLIDIANEERVHVGEFNRLIQLLTGDEDKWLADGAGEVDKMAQELAGPSVPAESPKTTVGSLKE